jgi:hypothetical protein
MSQVVGGNTRRATGGEGGGGAANKPSVEHPRELRVVEAHRPDEFECLGSHRGDAAAVVAVVAVAEAAAEAAAEEAG